MQHPIMLTAVQVSVTQPKSALSVDLKLNTISRLPPTRTLQEHCLKTCELQCHH